MSTERSRQDGQERRLYGLCASFAVAALVLGARLFISAFTIPVAGEPPKNLSAGKRQFPRGTIVDRAGLPLAFDIFQYDIEASPAGLEAEQRETLAEALADILHLPYEDVLEKLKTNLPYVPLAKRQDADVADAVEALLRHENWPVQAVPHPVRYYPEGSLAAHVLGFVNWEPRGYYGVEAYYDDELRGKEIPIEELESASLEATQGASTTLVLTIDKYAQHVAEEELRAAIQRTRAIGGQVIVLAPQTGEVLAMASWPTYEPGKFAEYDDDVRQNPAVSGIYEPGSVFKVITYAAALESKTIRPTDSLYDGGKIEIGGRTYYNWDRRARGWVTVTQALGDSLNVVAADIAQRMKKETFYKYVRSFGFGRLTEIDLDGEVLGLVKSPLDPASAPMWSDSDLGANSFGQGISVTPIQMVSAVASIANGGLLMSPYVVKEKLVNGEVLQTSPQAMRRTVSAETAQTLTSILVDVVDHFIPGARVPGYSIAGKTGTAEIPIGGGYHPSDYIASFIGYGPASNPQVVILVKIDRPQTVKSGSEAAAPVFGKIAARLFPYLGIPGDRPY